MPDAAYGLGYPFFSYYAAAPYYLAAILHVFGLDLLSTIKLTQTIFSIAAALGMYGWARRMLGSRAGGWLAGAAYALAPFHVANLYVRGDSLSEFAAFALYPLILWGADHLAERPSAHRTLPLALGYAGLILTHNISALIFSPFIVLYLAVLGWRRKGKRGRVLGFGLMACVLGLLLSAWFWLPALLERDLVQLTAQTTGYFFYGNHFRRVDLVQHSTPFDYGIQQGSTPFAMGLTQAMATIAGAVTILASWIRRRRIDWTEGTALAGLVLSTWMIVPLSRPLWDHLPLLPLVQFPWRFLSVQALFAALVIGALIRALPIGRQVLAATLTLLLAAGGLGALRPDYLPITAEEVTVQRLQLYELFTGNVGSTIRYEYLPRSVVPRPWTGPALFDPQAPPQAIPLTGELVVAQEISHRPTRRVWVVEVGGEETQIAFPLYYWAGWQGTVDGQPVEVGPVPDSGLLALSVPPGEHTIVLRLSRTGLRSAAEILSLMALLAVAVLGWTGLHRASRQGQLNFQQLGLGFAAGGLALTLLVALSPRLVSADDTDLTMDFEQMPLLHHNPAGVDFGPVQLMAYEYSGERMTAGDALTLTLEWAGETEGLTATASLVSPAVHLLDVPDGWADASVPLTQTAVISLGVPAETSPGPALVALKINGPEGELQPRSPAGRSLGKTFLRSVWVEAKQPAPPGVLAEMANGVIRLHTLEATQTSSDRLQVRMEWSAARPPISNWGLSLRLIDPVGNEWSRLESQPGYGFMPTGLWSPGLLLPDRVILPVPPGTPPGPGYTLSVSPYRVTTWEGLGEITTTVPLTRATLRPSAPILAHVEGGLALSALETPTQVRQGEKLQWTAWWLALERPQRASTQWQLEGPTVLSATLPLAPGSDPATWPTGALVAGRAELPIPPDFPAGVYTLTLTLRDAAGLPLRSYTHSRPVTVEERERVWELPEMEREVRATFGGMIQLAGYDLEEEEGALRLTFYWQALEVPDRHYMFFVHVADPSTARPVAQVDTMPRAFTYPTGMWAAGEVVSDQVEVSLENVPSGVYELAVGWYDPETEERLRARAADEQLLPQGRLVLPDRVVIP
jgi:hypothetical protein